VRQVPGLLLHLGPRKRRDHQITIYEYATKKVVAGFSQDEWMWSVNWVLKREIKNLYKTGDEEQRGPVESDLEAYMILGSDQKDFHLFSFVAGRDTGGVILERVKHKKMNLRPHESFQTSRFSLVRKVPGEALFVAGLQHINTVFLLRIVTLGGHLLLQAKRLNTAGLFLLTGLDAFVQTTSQHSYLMIVMMSFLKRLVVLRADLDGLQGFF
jgi:hypothetical protein